MKYIQAWAVGFNETQQEVIPLELIGKNGSGRSTVSGIVGHEVKADIEMCYLAVQYQCAKQNFRADNFDVHVHFPLRNVMISGCSYRLSLVNALCEMLGLPNKFFAAESVLTGDVSLSGEVFHVDGLEQKYRAFKQNNLRNFIIPNNPDLDDYFDTRVVKINDICSLIEFPKSEKIL